MSKELTKEEIEQLLAWKKTQISSRVETIRHEFSYPRVHFERFLREQPLPFLVGALAAGALVGMLLAGSGGSRREKKRRKAERALSSYLREAAGKGNKAGFSEDVLQHLLEEQPPIVIYAPGEERRDSSGTKRLLTFLLSSAAGLALNIGKTVLQEQLSAMYGSEQHAESS